MSKKVSGFILLLFGLIILTGVYFLFSNRLPDAETILHQACKKQDQIKSYHTRLNLEMNTGSSTFEYEVEVWFSHPEQYRVEITSGSPDERQIFLSDGERIYVYSLELDDHYALNTFSTEGPSPPFLLGTFISKMIGAQGVELLGTEERSGRNYYLLKIIPPSPARYSAWEKVWLDKRTLLPVQIDIYNMHNQLQQRIVFHSIELNPRLDPALFQP